MDSSQADKPTESVSDSDGLTRREFLGYTSGLILLFSLAPELAAQAGTPASRGAQDRLDAWLRIGPDNRVTVFTGAVEVGQGIQTALAQMVAEELTLPVSAVDMVMGDTDRVPEVQTPSPAAAVATTGVRLRQAAAEMREILAHLAAEKWGVSRDAIVVCEGKAVLTGRMGVEARLGELAGEGPTIRRLDKAATPLAAGEHRVIGNPVPRVEGRGLVTGEAKFVGDLRLPGMVYGAVLRPPCPNAQMAEVDTTAAAQQPGVLAVVRDGDLVAVVAARPDLARKALALINASWREPEHLPMSALFRDLRSSAQLNGSPRQTGDVETALAQARHGFNATYRTPFVAHAAIEPRGAVAAVEGDRITVYASTQRPFAHRAAVAEALGLPASRVRVVACPVGGAFGGKNAGDASVEAARLSRAVGRPVMVTWERSEEMTQSYFGPAALIDVRCGVSQAGDIVAWDCDVLNCEPNGAIPPYTFPNVRVRPFRCRSPLRQGWWRGCGGPANTFAREVHVDHIASQMAADPIELRLRHLSGNPRLARCVEAASERYGWHSHRAPSGLGVGVACAVAAGACVAQIAEVEVNRLSGAVRVRRVVVAQESGLIINPDGIRNQIEGAVIMGLGLALQEAVRYEHGRILTSHFSSYPIPTIRDAPAIDTVLVPNPDYPPQGAGAAPVLPVSAAVANAVFDATGKRFRELPLLPDRVLSALRS
jgi:nicotinate dehydrogenase subunit B